MYIRSFVYSFLYVFVPLTVIFILLNIYNEFD